MSIHNSYMRLIMKKSLMVWIFTLCSSYQAHGARIVPEERIEIPSSPQSDLSEEYTVFPVFTLEPQERDFYFVESAIDRSKKAWKKQKKKLKNFTQTNFSLLFIKNLVQKDLQKDFQKFEVEIDQWEDHDSPEWEEYWLAYLEYQLVQKSLDASIAKAAEVVKPSDRKCYKVYKEFWFHYSHFLSKIINFIRSNEYNVQPLVGIYLHVFHGELASPSAFHEVPLGSWYKAMRENREPLSRVLQDGDLQRLHEFFSRVEGLSL